MKIFTVDTGTLTPGSTSAKRSMPRPLLVVHSGNTTTGRSAPRTICSSGSAGPGPTANGGTRPAARSIVQREARRKPLSAILELGARVAGEEMAAEPVPVLRPGVLVTGAEVTAASWGRDTGSGSTKIGSKLTDRGST
jgi:hypothetical protein